MLSTQTSKEMHCKYSMQPNKETRCKYNSLFGCVSICSTCGQIHFIWSCSVLSSLGHRTYCSQWLVIIEVNPIPLSQIIRQYGLHFDCYADATQFLPVFVNESVGWRPKISCQQIHAFWILVTQKKKKKKTCETKSCVLPVSIIFIFPVKMFYESEEKFAHKTLFTSKNKCSLARSDSLKIKRLNDVFSLKLASFLFMTLIDELKSCGLLWCLSVVWTHSDGTHSLQRIHRWAGDVMLHFSKSLLMKKQTHRHLGRPEGE